MKRIIQPIPFSVSPYSIDTISAYERVLDTKGASDKAADNFPSNLLLSHCEVLNSISVRNSLPAYSSEDYVDLVNQLQQETVKNLGPALKNADKALIFGGDHSISMATGAALAQSHKMSKIGLIWIDAHGDFNTPQTSLSKSPTGYPAAVNMGSGDPKLLDPYKNNFIAKQVQIGLRDVEELEAQNQQKHEVTTYSILDIEHLGLKTILDQTIDLLQECDKIWLSIDIDSLDPIYFLEGETDLPVFAGLTPRELVYITHRIAQTNKLFVTEITQLHDIGKQTPLVTLASRIAEISMGLGEFRYG